jgi:hypothetical protein
MWISLHSSFSAHWVRAQRPMDMERSKHHKNNLLHRGVIGQVRHSTSALDTKMCAKGPPQTAHICMRPSALLINIRCFCTLSQMIRRHAIGIG